MPSKPFSLAVGLSTVNPQVTALVVPSLFMYARGMPGGHIFDELAGLSDPAPKEPTVDPGGQKVGRFNVDGSYEPYDNRDRMLMELAYRVKQLNKVVFRENPYASS